MTGTILTDLGNGIETVPADDPRLAEREALRVRLAEREALRVRLMHVANMRRLDLHGRRDYLANVERREGAEARAALETEFTADWQARKEAT